jgi:hypothetical protein
MSERLELIIRRADRDGTDNVMRLPFANRVEAALTTVRVMWTMLDVYGKDLITRDGPNEGEVLVFKPVDGKEMHIFTLTYVQ